MFGPRLRVVMDEFGVTLVPIEKKDMDAVIPLFSSLVVHQYTQRYAGVVTEDEHEWWEKMRTDKQQIVWGIKPDGGEVIVGITGIHDIDIFGGCATGIIIADTKWHGKGVATRAHLMRTMYAADHLARLTIRSDVYVPNEASRRALERVGYMVTGKELRRGFGKGAYSIEIRTCCRGYTRRKLAFCIRMACRKNTRKELTEHALRLRKRED